MVHQGLQPCIRVQLWGGCEFQLPELLYLLGENFILIWWNLFKATYQEKVEINLNPFVDMLENCWICPWNLTHGNEGLDEGLK